MAGLTHNPATYWRSAFTALHWPSITFDAAMQCPARRDIIEFIATWWPQRPMCNIVSISRIDLLATDAAQRGDTAHSANPYPSHTPPGQLWLKCFAAEQARMALAAAAQAESVYSND
ncbi:MAG: hypothetical protein HQ446_01305 [Polaromonas sp.]|nr:hypothetical protein [Polaromonas sp.]